MGDEKKREFYANHETRSGVLKSMIDLQAGAFVIHADSLETKVDGGTRVQIGFPALIVTGWVNNPEAFATKIAALMKDQFG